VENMSTLAQIHVGRRCRVVTTEVASPEAQAHLEAMGIFPGVEMKVLREAPLGDPIQVRIGVSLMSIRKQEAACIGVESVL
jgi:ferrous iron transport protein A